MQAWKQKALLILLTALLFAAGCAAAETAPSQAPAQVQEVTPLPAPTLTLDPPAAETAARPRETAGPPSAEAPGEAAPPEATGTATETATATAEAETAAAEEEESVTPASTPGALPDGWYGPQNFPPDMNPLTGEIVADPALLDRRPIAIKVSNYPALGAPPGGAQQC